MNSKRGPECRAGEACSFNFFNHGEPVHNALGLQGLGGEGADGH